MALCLSRLCPRLRLRTDLPIKPLSAGREIYPPASTPRDLQLLQKPDRPFKSTSSKQHRLRLTTTGSFLPPTINDRLQEPRTPKHQKPCPHPRHPPAPLDRVAHPTARPQAKHTSPCPRSPSTRSANTNPRPLFPTALLVHPSMKASSWSHTGAPAPHPRPTIHQEPWSASTPAQKRAQNRMTPKPSGAHTSRRRHRPELCSRTANHHATTPPSSPATKRKPSAATIPPPWLTVPHQPQPAPKPHPKPTNSNAASTNSRPRKPATWNGRSRSWATKWRRCRWIGRGTRRGVAALRW